MSDLPDIVSKCCRAEITAWKFPRPFFACHKCGQECTAIRPDRTPSQFDPPRAKWNRKPEFITDAVAKSAKDSREVEGSNDPWEPR